MKKTLGLALLPTACLCAAISLTVPAAAEEAAAVQTGWQTENGKRCYYDAAGKLCIKVVPQQPILHVISQKGEDYYLSSTGLSMPTASFNVDLCVATGNITKKFASEHLLELARYIHDDLFWREQIEQIYVVSPEEIRLYPRVGQHIIELGNSDNFQEKLNRLRIFYREGLERVGWNKYQMISLAYDGQVVCTKANNKKNK